MLNQIGLQSVEIAVLLCRRSLMVKHLRNYSLDVLLNEVDMQRVMRVSSFREVTANSQCLKGEVQTKEKRRSGVAKNSFALKGNNFGMFQLPVAEATGYVSLPLCGKELTIYRRSVVKN